MPGYRRPAIIPKFLMGSGVRRMGVCLGCPGPCEIGKELGMGLWPADMCTHYAVRVLLQGFLARRDAVAPWCAQRRGRE